MKKKDEETNEYIVRFHNENIYLPTRTIYFAGDRYSEDEVDSLSISCLIKNLQILECEKIAPISILLNSSGGSWDDGIVVYDMIRTLRSKVTIVGLGKLYSMGSLLFQAGDKRLIFPNTTMMVHDGSDGYFGDSKSYEAWAEYSKKIRATMYKIYHEKMVVENKNITLKKIEKICSHDAVFDSKQMIKLGLADKIINYIK